MVVAFDVTVWPRESDYHDKEDRIFWNTNNNIFRLWLSGLYILNLGVSNSSRISQKSWWFRMISEDFNSHSKSNKKRTRRHPKKQDIAIRDPTTIEDLSKKVFLNVFIESGKKSTNFCKSLNRTHAIAYTISCLSCRPWGESYHRHISCDFSFSYPMDTVPNYTWTDGVYPD